MSQKTMTVCDYPVRGAKCGKDAVTPLSVKMGKQNATGDYCKQHEKDAAEALQKVGIEVKTVMTSNSKPRKAMTTKSGKKYTTSDARQWLVANKHIEAGGTGRLPKDKLKLYADAN